MSEGLKADFDHQLDSFVRGGSGGPIFEQIIANSFSYAGRHNGVHCCEREEVGAGKRSQLFLLAA